MSAVTSATKGGGAVTVKVTSLGVELRRVVDSYGNEERDTNAIMLWGTCTMADTSKLYWHAATALYEAVEEAGTTASRIADQRFSEKLQSGICKVEFLARRLQVSLEIYELWNAFARCAPSILPKVADDALLNPMLEEVLDVSLEIDGAYETSLKDEFVRMASFGTSQENLDAVFDGRDRIIEAIDSLPNNLLHRHIINRLQRSIGTVKRVARDLHTPSSEGWLDGFMDNAKRCMDELHTAIRMDNLLNHIERRVMAKLESEEDDWSGPVARAAKRLMEKRSLKPLFDEEVAVLESEDDDPWMGDDSVDYFDYDDYGDESPDDE